MSAGAASPSEVAWVPRYGEDDRDSCQARVSGGCSSTVRVRSPCGVAGNRAGGTGIYEDHDPFVTLLLIGLVNACSPLDGRALVSVAVIQGPAGRAAIYGLFSPGNVEEVAYCAAKGNAYGQYGIKEEQSPCGGMFFAREAYPGD